MSSTERVQADRQAARPRVASVRRGRPTSLLRRVSRILLHLVIMGLGAVAALLAFQLVFMPLAVGHGKDIRVPKVVGLDVARAEEALSGAGLAARRLSERVSPEFRAGVVLDQDPRPGFSTREGRVVGLVVSLGRGEVQVPDVAGESYRHAEIIMTRDGIAVGHVARTYADAPIDEVLKISPGAGTTVVTGRAVDVLLSAGPAPDAFIMPDFRGADPDQVARALRRLGYVVDVAYPVGALSLRGRVLSHTPPPGHRLETGDEIRILAGEL